MTASKDNELSSYMLEGVNGAADLHVFETDKRMALRSDDSSLWSLYRKKPDFGQSDDEGLDPAYVVDDEDEARRWVIEGDKDDLKGVEVVSYTLAGAVGSPAQHVLESRTRFATRNDDEEGWLIGTKRPSALTRPISDWDYEELFYLSEEVFVLESEAARWVAEGGAPLKDSIVEWRSPFERKPKP